MAKVISIATDSGQSMFFHVRKRDAYIWNTVGLAFEAYSSANYAQYKVALTEEGSCGFYKTNLPAGITWVDRYTLVFYNGSGTVEGQDFFVGSIPFDYDGKNEAVPPFALMISGSTIAGILSSTQATTDLTETTNDHYKGRIVMWRTGALIGQVTDITAYDGATKTMTFTALTEAPAAGDEFVIV